MTVRKIGETAVLSPVRRISLLAMAVIIFISVTAFAAPPVMRDVCIRDGKTVYTFSTYQNNPEKIVEEAGFNVNPAYGDKLEITGFDGENDNIIVIKRGVKVTIRIFDGSIYAVYASGTVSDALEAAQVSVPAGSAMNYAADEELFSDMEIEVYGIYNITVKADGKKITSSVSGKTVADGLKALGVTLGDDDYTKPDEETNLADGQTVTVYRVTLKTRVENAVVPYETEYKYTDELYTDESKTLINGINGAEEVTFTDYYVNGEFSKSEMTAEKITKKPVNKVLSVGTKKRPQPSTVLPQTHSTISELAVPSYVHIGSNGLPENYRSVINAKATAYCTPGDLTSTGVICRTGYIAVDPKEIPYGTEMFIVSADGKYVYGYCVAADTGGFIYDVDWTVDLYMNSEEQCIQWGRRDIVIYVL